MPSNGVVHALSVSSQQLAVDYASVGTRNRQIRDVTTSTTLLVNTGAISAKAPMDVQVGQRGAAVSLYVAGPPAPGENVTFNGGSVEQGLALKVEQGESVFDTITTRKLVVLEPDTESSDAKVTKADIDKVAQKSVSITGSQMSGPLLLPPVSSNHPNAAVSRSFVETAIRDSENRAKTAFLPAAGGQIASKIKQPPTLPTDPNDTVCTKGYVLSLLDGKGSSVDASAFVPLTGATLSGKLYAPAPIDTDPNETVINKGYLDARLLAERDASASVFISKNQDATLSGKLHTSQTNANDSDDTLATKLYVDSSVAHMKEELGTAQASGVGSIQDLTVLDNRYAPIAGGTFSGKPKAAQTSIADSDDTLVTKLFTENLVAIAMDNAIKESASEMRNSCVLLEGGEMTGALYLPQTATVQDNQAITKSNAKQMIQTAFNGIFDAIYVKDYLDATGDVASALQRAVNTASQREGADGIVFTVVIHSGVNSIKTPIVVPETGVFIIRGESSRDSQQSEAWKTVLDVSAESAFVVKGSNVTFEHLGFISTHQTTGFIKAQGGVDLFNCHFLVTGTSDAGELTAVQLHSDAKSTGVPNTFQDCSFSNHCTTDASPKLTYIACNTQVNSQAELRLVNVVLDGGKASVSVGADISGVRSVSLENVTLQMLQNGLILNDVGRTKVAGCVSDTVVNSVVSLDVGHTVMITNNVFRNSLMVLGISNSGTVMVNNNEFEDCGSNTTRVIVMDGNKRTQIHGNVFKQCVGWLAPVLSTSNSQTVASLIVVSENIFDRLDPSIEDTYHTPIQLDGTHGAVIVANNIFDCQKSNSDISTNVSTKM